MKIKYIKTKIFSFLLLIVMLVLTGFVGNYIWKNIQSQKMISFKGRAESIAKIIDIRLTRDVYLLYSMRGFYAASELVDENEFKTFGENVQLEEKFPGIYAIGFLEKKSIDGIDSFGPKYLYPSRVNPSFLNVDFSQDERLKEIFAESIKNNGPTIAEKMNIGGEHEEGMIIFLPIYKNGFSVSTEEERSRSLDGFACVIIENEKFFDSIMQLEEIDWKNLDLYINNQAPGSDIEANNFLYDLDKESKDEYKAKTFTYLDVPLSIANKIWTLHFVTDFDDVANKWEKIVAIMLFMFGVVFSFIVASAFYIMGSSRGRALDAAENMTKDLRKEKNKADELSRDLEKFKLAVEGASDHIVITDSEGLIVYMNQAAEKITGYSVKESLGKKAGSKKLWGGQMSDDFYKKMWKTIKTKKEIFSGEVTNVRKNGQKYEALASISPIVDGRGNVKFFVGIERDVTKVKEIDRMKSEFVSVASHQLRTPLTGIRWFSELLLEDGKKISKEHREYIQEIYNSNERMINLVNDLLNVSRIETGRNFEVRKEKTDINLILREVIEEQAPLAKKKKIKINHSENLSDKFLLNIDGVKIRQVFQNLLSNAIKYSPEKTSITIDQIKKGRKTIFFVKDSGFGIPVDQQGRIFEKFFRASNVLMTGAEGTGLGLYIVKSIVEAHRGKIWFESKENDGTTFFVEIP